MASQTRRASRAPNPPSRRRAPTHRRERTRREVAKSNCNAFYNFWGVTAAASAARPGPQCAGPGTAHYQPTRDTVTRRPSSRQTPQRRHRTHSQSVAATLATAMSTPEKATAAIAAVSGLSIVSQPTHPNPPTARDPAASLASPLPRDLRLPDGLPFMSTLHPLPRTSAAG